MATTAIQPGRTAAGRLGQPSRIRCILENKLSPRCTSLWRCPTPPPLVTLAGALRPALPLPLLACSCFISNACPLQFKQARLATKRTKERGLNATGAAQVPAPGTSLLCCCQRRCGTGVHRKEHKRVASALLPSPAGYWQPLKPLTMPPGPDRAHTWAALPSELLQQAARLLGDDDR